MNKKILFLMLTLATANVSASLLEGASKSASKKGGLQIFSAVAGDSTPAKQRKKIEIAEGTFGCELLQRMEAVEKELEAAKNNQLATLQDSHITSLFYAALMVGGAELMRYLYSLKQKAAKIEKKRRALKEKKKKIVKHDEPATEEPEIEQPAPLSQTEEQKS